LQSAKVKITFPYRLDKATPYLSILHFLPINRDILHFSLAGFKNLTYPFSFELNQHCKELTKIRVKPLFHLKGENL